MGAAAERAHPCDRVLWCLAEPASLGGADRFESKSDFPQERVGVWTGSWRLCSRVTQAPRLGGECQTCAGGFKDQSLVVEERVLEAPSEAVARLDRCDAGSRADLRASNHETAPVRARARDGYVQLDSIR